MLISCSSRSGLSVRSPRLIVMAIAATVCGERKGETLHVRQLPSERQQNPDRYGE
jgi:hypothetical protein